MNTCKIKITSPPNTLIKGENSNFTVETWVERLPELTDQYHMILTRHVKILPCDRSFQEWRSSVWPIRWHIIHAFGFLMVQS